MVIEAKAEIAEESLTVPILTFPILTYVDSGFRRNDGGGAGMTEGRGDFERRDPHSNLLCSNLRGFRLLPE